MILPSPDKLNRFNKYALVILAAKRARQLQEQGIARRSLVKSASSNPLTIALEEIAAGRLIPTFEVQPVPELMEPEVPETPLTIQEFEEAMAKVAMSVEAESKASDNGHEEEAAQELALEEDEEPVEAEDVAVSNEIDEVLGLNEEEEAEHPASEEIDEVLGLNEGEDIEHSASDETIGDDTNNEQA